MRHLTFWVTVLVAGCGKPAASKQHAPPTSHRWVSDAVSPHEGILGRVVDGDVVRLLTTEQRIVEIDLQERRATQIPLRGIDGDERLIGLARLPDGSLWTLSGWTTLLQLGEDGRVVERRELQRRYAGLHSGYGRLLYQPFDFAGRAPTLVTIDDDEEHPRSWGTLKVREGTENGPLRLAQSLVSCGPMVTGRVPCWVANAAAVELMDSEGRGQMVEISALREWTPTSSAFASNPHRVIRDVWLASPSTMWLLARATEDVPDPRGERGLWRVNVHGEVTERHVLGSRARVILAVLPGCVVVLTTDGHVVAEEV